MQPQSCLCTRACVAFVCSVHVHAYTYKTWLHKGMLKIKILFLQVPVLTRREQLGLNHADKKDSGRGGGRGRGRGRKGGGGKKKETEAKDIEVPPVATEQHESEGKKLDKKTQKTKRVLNPPCTPERRELFPADGTSPMKVDGKDENPNETSPPIKQTPKRRRAAKGKAKAAAKTKGKKDGEEASSSKGSGPSEIAQGEKKEEKTEEKQEKGDGGGGEVKKNRTISDTQKTWAMDYLTDMKKTDEAGWEHVEKLFSATKVAERLSVSKFAFFTLSMYWSTRRVGLLQRKPEGGTCRHVLSFGGGACTHIGIPTEACRLYVSYWVCWCDCVFVRLNTLTKPKCIHEI